MFFFSRERDESVKLTKKILKTSKIPLLIEYEPWKKLFTSGVSKDITDTTLEMNRMLKENVALKGELEGHYKEKRTTMAEIVLVSNQINEEGNHEAEVKLDQLKNKLEELNMKIDEKTSRMEDIPKEVDELNLLLLEETVRYVYENMGSDKGALQEVNAKIEEYRKELDVLREKREKLDDKIDTMYSFLHGLVGHREMEKLDKKFLK